MYVYSLSYAFKQKNTCNFNNYVCISRKKEQKENNH